MPPGSASGECQKRQSAGPSGQVPAWLWLNACASPPWSWPPHHAAGCFSGTDELPSSRHTQDSCGSVLAQHVGTPCPWGRA
eukprot:1276268-Rhodomonas_salina.1